MRSRARVLVGAMAVLTLLAACGGGEENDSGGVDRTATETVNGVEAAAAAIVEEWGEADGFAVTLIALDKGYTVEQITASPDLAADGSIAGVEPAGEASGLVEVAPGDVGSTGTDEESLPAGSVQLVGLAAPAGQSPSDGFVGFVEQSLGEIWDAGEEALQRQEAAERHELYLAVVTLGLARAGYTTEQIIDALLDGTAVATDRDAGVCLEVEGVAPAGQDAPVDGGCIDLSEPDSSGGSEDDGDAAVYSGELEFDRQSTAYEQVDVPENEVVIGVEDGAVVDVAVDYAEVYRTCDDGAGNLQCTNEYDFRGAFTGDPVDISTGAASVPIQLTETQLSCDGPAQLCKDYPPGESSTAELTLELSLEGDEILGTVEAGGSTVALIQTTAT